MKIVLTENAEKTYFDILNKYSKNKANLFSKNTISVLNMIAENNHIGSKHRKTLYRKFLISHQVYVFYKLEPQIIYVVLFWYNKRNPINLDIMLSS
jgi:plasmid stabilization system protein ParE